MRRPLEAGSFLAGSIVPPKKAGLDMRPRTVIIFGNPRAGTPDDQERYTGNRSSDEGRRLAGRSGQGLTYNTSEYNAKYVFPRHGVATSGDVSKALETFLTKVTDQSTQ